MSASHSSPDLYGITRLGVPEPGCGPTPVGVPEPECGPTPSRRPALSVAQPPSGCPVLVPWPDRLGGVFRYPPGTVADPSRQRLRQWVAVSAAGETAGRRAVVRRCLGSPPRVVRFHLVSPACARRQAVTALREAHPLPQPTPSGCPALGVVQPPGDARPWVWSNPLGALVLVSWPDRLGGGFRYPPGTAADPPRPRLRQWVAVSAASETACRRAAVHRCLGSPPRVVRFHLTSPACARRQAATALREAHPLPQPTPSGCPALGVVQPPGDARPWVWSNPLRAPVLVPWPHPLGGRCGVHPSWGPGVSRHPPRTAADPSRQRLRQWVAVSAASETACRRAAVHRCLGGPPRVVRFHLVSPACARRQAVTALREAHPLPQPTPSGCPALGVVQPPGDARPWVWSNPLGALVLVSWPDRLGGVFRYPPGTAADPPRQRLRQWVAVSAASETACRRAAVHRCLGSPPWVVRFHLVSPACARRQAVTALRDAHPLPQPTPSGCPALGVLQPPGDARLCVWSNPLGALVLVSWPDRLGGVFRHPPGTAADPPRPRLRQWGLNARSAVRQLAAERTPHLSAGAPTSGAPLAGTCTTLSAASWLAR